MNLDMFNMVVLKYLKENPERFNLWEKQKFLHDVQVWLEGKSEFIDDEVFDFLVSTGIAQKNNREEDFLSYLNSKYGVIRFHKILDVGAGRMCKLSKILARYGNSMYAIDPNIRLSANEAKNLNIKGIMPQKFMCDEYSKNGKGTNIKHYDMLVGLEPCDATEHIIRQGLKYDKPFDVLLCAVPHKALNGKTFKSAQEWQEYLLSISSELTIKEHNKSNIISNVKDGEGFSK